MFLDHLWGLTIRDFLREIKEDYNLCKKNPKQYAEKLNEISDLFGLEGKHRLVTDAFPSAIIGNYRKGHQFIIFGINPGYHKFTSLRDKDLRKQSWTMYRRISLRQRYKTMKSQDHPSPYYESFWKFFKGLMGDSVNPHEKWDFFNEHISNLNLIPYHSKGISLKKRFTLHQLEYLLPRFCSTLDFIKKYEPKMLLFNGKPWYTFLIYHNLVNHIEEKPVNKKFNLYFFDIDGIPCVLFEKFFSSHYFSLTDNDRSNKIPEMIQMKYPHLFK